MFYSIQIKGRNVSGSGGGTCRLRHSHTGHSTGIRDSPGQSEPRIPISPKYPTSVSQIGHDAEQFGP
jgi:hypothetical protein